jgi:hypothetical protein
MTSLFILYAQFTVKNFYVVILQLIKIKFGFIKLNIQIYVINKITDCFT